MSFRADVNRKGELLVEIITAEEKEKIELHGFLLSDLYRIAIDQLGMTEEEQIHL